MGQRDLDDDDEDERRLGRCGRGVQRGRQGRQGRRGRRHGYCSNLIFALKSAAAAMFRFVVILSP